MTHYTLSLAVSPDFDGTDEKKVTELVKKFVGTTGTVTGVTLQGKKPFMYPINKKTDGFYVLARVDSHALYVHDLQKRLEPGAGVMRFLLKVA